MSIPVSREQLFFCYSQAFVALGEERDSQWPLGLSSSQRIDRKTSEKQLLLKIEQVVRRIFDENKATVVSPAEIVAFVDHLELFLKNRKRFSELESCRIRNRVIHMLYRENLQYLPWKMVEVILCQKKERALTSVELRVLENGLGQIVEEFYNFKNLFYSYYFDYLGAMIGSKIEFLGGKIRNTEYVEIDWEQIPLQNPEAVTLVSVIQSAKEKSKLYLVLPELYKDFDFLDAESKNVLQMAMFDFLWDCVAEVRDLFDDKIVYSCIQQCRNEGNGCHPAIKKALEATSRFLSILDEIDDPKNKTKSDAEDYKAKQRCIPLRSCLLELLTQASLYKESFEHMHVLYSRGFALYTKEIALNHGFIPGGFNLPPPQEFEKEKIFVINIKDVDSLYSENINQLVPITSMDVGDRQDFLIGLIFQKRKQQQAVIDEIFCVPDDTSENKEGEELLRGVEESYLPKEFLRQMIQQRRKKTPGSGLKKSKVKKQNRPHVTDRSSKISQESDFYADVEVEKLSEAVDKLVISKPKLQPIESKPKKLPRAKKSIVCVEKENVLNGSLVKVQKVLSVRSVWIDSHCLEGSAQEIGDALNISISAQWHVKKVFNKLHDLEEGKQDIPQSLRNHTYPLFMAGIIQRNTKGNFLYSSRRGEDVDVGYSCSGSIKEYGEKKDFSLGVFTEGFFSKDTIDGKKGELFHHCFEERTSAQIIRRYRKTGTFYANEDIEDVEGEGNVVCKRKDKYLQNRFRVTFVRNSCMVDDMRMNRLFTMVFSHRCEIFP